MNNGVFIPIEIMPREYMIKLLLSVELIKKGMPVIIGHKGPVIKLALTSKEPGILFYKSTMAGGMEKTSELLRKKKFGIVAQDEEVGIIYKDFEDFYKRRTSLESVDELDLFFSWGKDDYDFLSQKTNKDIVQNYGGLRSCLWGELGKKIYQDEVNNIKKKYGNFILVASNLVKYNSYLNKKEFKKHLSKFKNFDINKFNKTYDIEKKIFYQYVDLIEFVTKKLNKKVVIRPHPSESILGWKDTLKGSKNVFVEREGEILTWILASEFLIQNNCTSAIEASAADIPVITYLDESDDLVCLSEGKENIPNKLSINVLGKDKFIETANNIDLIWNKKENKLYREKLLNKKLKNYGTTKTAEDIATKIIEYVGKPNSKGNESIGKDSFFFDIHELYRNSISSNYDLF